MTSNHFVFVESNSTGTGRLALETLLDRGERVTFLTRRPEMYAFLNSKRLGLTVAAVETNDTEAVIDEVLTIARRESVDVISSFSEYYALVVAEVAKELRMPGLAPEAARICRDKASLRAVMGAAGLITPWFRLIEPTDDAEGVANAVEYPCVLKPTSESGSKGVRLVRSPNEFREHLAILRRWNINERSQPVTGQVLVEEYVDGPEFSVETLTFEPERNVILGITTKHLSEHPDFVEIGHDFPSELPGQLALEVVSAVERALSAVGFDFGPSHTELRIGPRGPVVIEVNPRMAGGMIPELIRYASGVDFLRAYLDSLLGCAVDLAPRRTGGAAIRFLTSRQSGRLTRVTGCEQALELPQVRQVHMSKQLGDWVQPAQSAFDRVGFVIASGDTVRDARHAAESAHQLIQCEVSE